MKRLRRSLQFARALLRGARLYHRMGLPMLGLAWGVLASFFAPVGMLASERIFRRRLRACRKCPFYDPFLRTCGDGAGTLETEDGTLVPAGCQCWLPLKARLPRATCFMEDIGLPSRWAARP